MTGVLDILKMMNTENNYITGLCDDPYYTGNSNDPTNNQDAETRASTLEQHLETLPAGISRMFPKIMREETDFTPEIMDWRRENSPPPPTQHL